MPTIHQALWRNAILPTTCTLLSLTFYSLTFQSYFLTAFILTHYIASMYPSSHNLFQLHLCILCMYGWISAQVGINGILPGFKKIFKNCSFGITFRSSATFIPQVLRIDVTSESSQQSFKAMYENIKGDQTGQYYKMW